MHSDEEPAFMRGLQVRFDRMTERFDRLTERHIMALENIRASIEARDVAQRAWADEVTESGRRFLDALVLTSNELTKLRRENAESRAESRARIATLEARLAALEPGNG
jgi:hypothetical protein